MSTTKPASQLLRFITCGSVDDGKSTLIGRLLVDAKGVLQDQLAGVQRHGQVDLALLTDGLSAEREQGITIDVAHRYFATPSRKFIIGDTPGHEQYTRNMVTAASSADAAVVLVDATKLDWADAALKLLPQTRRHALLAHLLRVPSVVFAVNKLDAVADPQLAFGHIRAALQAFAREAGLDAQTVVPMSALLGWNVVNGPQQAGWCGYSGPTLLQILEHLPVRASETASSLAFPVQWVEKFSDRADTSESRRVYWGRVASGEVRTGQRVKVLPGGQQATVAKLLSHAREPLESLAGRSGGLVLDRELDISRGDWLLAVDDAGQAPAGVADEWDDTPAVAGMTARNRMPATVAWLDNESLVPGRVYWALHGHRWVKARVTRILHQLDIHTLDKIQVESLEPNAIGQVELSFQEALPASSYLQSRALGSMVLVDTRTHNTSGAVMVH